MQTETDTKTLSVPTIADVTAGDINTSFWAAMGGLENLTKKSIDVMGQFAHTGKLLAKKKSEFGPREGWYDWLAENCRDISRSTADRLMDISEPWELYRSRGNGIMPLPDRLTSIRGIHEALIKAIHPSEAPEEKNRAEIEAEEAKKEKALISKVKASFRGFWRVIAGRPPEKWEPEERASFLVDLAGRERIRRERGWELPSIDIETETETVS